MSVNILERSHSNVIFAGKYLLINLALLNMRIRADCRNAKIARTITLTGPGPIDGIEIADPA